MKRSLIEPVLARFDLADTDSSCAARSTTTQPGQALAMLNGEFFQERARALAARLEREFADDRAAQVASRAAARALAREPTPEELESELAFLAELESGSAWRRALRSSASASVTLNRSETLYLD